MTALAAAVAIGDNQLLIDAPFAAGQVPCWVKIDTEMLYAGGQHFRTGTTLTLSAPATATHSNGATVTYAGRPYDADFRSATGGVGGGAIPVDNLVDPPVDVTGIVAAGATFDGTEVTLRGKDFYAQDTDPGAVGAGSVWKNTADSDGPLWERNVGNTAWLPQFIAIAESDGDGDANVSRHASAAGDGDAVASSNAITNGAGLAVAGLAATASGDGPAVIDLYAEAQGAGAADIPINATAATGTASAELRAIRGAATAGVTMVVDGTSARMGFNGVTPVAKPTGVAVTAGGIHAALVSLGLIEA